MARMQRLTRQPVMVLRLKRRTAHPQKHLLKIMMILHSLQWKLTPLPRLS